MTSVGVYRALDATFELRASASLARVLRTAHADLLAPEVTSPRHVVEVGRRWQGGWQTRVDGSVRVSGVDASDALNEVRRAINDLAAESVVATDTILNAGAVEIDGRAVAFVGPGSSGKTSLTLVATRHGHGYLADDVVAVDPSGRARPFHRPLGVRTEEAGRLEVAVPRGPFDYAVPLRLGDRATLSAGAPLAAVMLVDKGVFDVECTRLDAADALMKLTNQSLRLPGHERVLFRRLEMLVRRVPVWSVRFGAPDEALAAVASLLTDPPPV
jgi:hypothetical protein